MRRYYSPGPIPCLTRHHRAGGVILIVAVALVALVLCAALAIDVGQSMTIAGRCQNLADAAALAAAAGPIASQSAAVNARIQDIMDANANTALPATWNSAELITYAGGATVPGYGTLGASDEAIAVKAHITATYGFARLAGQDTVDIYRSATALRQVNSTAGGMFIALDPATADTGIDVAGSSANFKGIIHSNTRIVITGSAHHFWDWVEWINRLTAGSGYTWDKGDRPSTVVPDPLASLTVDSFKPYTYEIFGNYSMTGSNKTVPPGVYRVHGNVSIGGSSQTANNVTFVADGDIGATGSNFQYSCNRLGIFAYTTGNNMLSAIDVSGSGANCVGGLYAPNGKAKFSGSANAFIKTSVIAWKIGITGSSYTVQPTPNFFPTAASVRLIK